MQVEGGDHHHGEVIPFPSKLWFESLFWYQTVKVVQIRNWKLGLLHYTMMLLILGYVIGWVILLNHGYQGTDSLLGSTYFKVKGNTFVCPNNVCPTDISNITVWDAYDVVQPPKEPDAVFLTTNFLITPKQTRGSCVGTDPATETCINNNSTCITPVWGSTANGISTGNCYPNSSYCEILGWCEAEDDIQEYNILSTLPSTFTLLLRTDITFPLYNISMNNLLPGNATNPNPNIFNMSSILAWAGVNDTYNQCLLNGCVIIGMVSYDCNFDASDVCFPEYNWILLNTTVKPSVGFNFRYTKNYYLPGENGTWVEYRDLYKVYGIRMVFIVTGVGRKFSVIPLFLNIGSGLALLSLATLTTDYVLIYLLKKKTFYRDIKFKNVDDDGPLLGLVNKEAPDERSSLLA
eukprot:TRINITY_DN2272_c0_g1_i1.p1 TRINITY_DN2272_c0_g1~~TRINITY_DN2272_c0_g1_i1.p1  ORF type:complete len:405 (+),score=99.99 TRINITY_DN2272_c0_g1_i1:230-1444(+)